MWEQHTTLVLVAAQLAVFVAFGWLRARQLIRDSWHAHARLVEVLAPAALDFPTTLAGGRRVWTDLMGIAHPWRRRLLGGQPHLVLEYWLAPNEIIVRVWIPGPVPPGRVENAIRAAWPGALITHTTEGPSTLDAAGTVTGGTVRPERAEHLPLRVPDARTDTDPLRSLESLATALRPGESVVVQVLARPAVGRRLRRYRATVRRVHTGRSARTSIITSLIAGLVREMLDLVIGSRPHHATTSTEGRWRPTDPQQAEELREVRAKATLPLWEVALRYAAAVPGSGRESRDRARGVADGVFALFALFAGRNALARHRLRHPATVVAGRSLRRGALLSVAELAALAHLPTRTTELSGNRTRPVPAPHQVTGHPHH
ncbi:hypothetical protein [Kutzneria sp. 744]|uniref:hypothetical protein n=1 Tax=Kutzneria sp. (strain 744) TaxID=345341 RepID=UPI0004B549E9|nr:hypothetical protein [Kutzneria sp. 744]